MARPKLMNLDALSDGGRAIVKGGATYGVRPMTPRTAEMLGAASRETDSDRKAIAFYDVVAALVPTMPRDVVDDCSTAQVLAVLDLASTPDAELAGEGVSGAIAEVAP